MYYKIINDRTIFSDCKTIQLGTGQWISNPSEQQIADAGWVVYVPPEVIPSPQTEPDYDTILQAVKTMLASSTENLTDEDALGVAALFPTWVSKTGQEVIAGERLWYDGKLYKVIQPHTIQADWTPDIAVSLFTEVTIEEWPDIPEVITAENAWMKGQKGIWKGEHYISTIDNNVWNPDVYPGGWEKQ